MKKKVGRPKKKEASKSYTVSLLPSIRKYIIIKHGSLTIAIKTLYEKI